MKIETLQFGELAWEEAEVFTFPHGLPGFEECTRYVFVQPDEKLPFYCLQSLEDGNLSFIVTNPFNFYADYDFELPEAVQQELNIEGQEQVAVWSIVTITDRFQEASLNLLAPLIVNVNTQQGKQVILHDTSYKTKHPMLRG